MRNLPKVGKSSTGKRKTLREAPAHPKDAYSHPTSVNGNIDTVRKPIKRGKIKK